MLFDHGELHPDTNMTSLTSWIVEFREKIGASIPSLAKLFGHEYDKVRSMAISLYKRIIGRGEPYLNTVVT